MLKNKILLITGGTGSFGKSVLNNFLKTSVKEIRIFSRDEKKQEDMRIAYDNPKLKFYIGDVRNLSSIVQATINVNYIFHAAALKQVPSCEFYPIEAIKTNVIGAENVLEASRINHIENVVLLSTDKAVYPINAMGMTKAIMEKIMIARSRNTLKGQTFSATRYGNVMTSRGSVIPLFVSQIKNNQPITITNPNMTRFMMSLTEAVHLVEFAFSHANSGDVFVHKAPAVKIQILAQALKELFNSNVKIKIIGSRHSEKLYETLLTNEEMQVAENIGHYYRIPADNRDLNYSQYLSQGDIKLSHTQEYNSNNAEQLSLSKMKDLLLSLDYIQNALK